MSETAIDTQPEAFTDLAYADRFAEANEHGLIHVEGQGWLAYGDGCWRPDHKQAVRHGKALAEATVIDTLATLDTKASGRAVKRCSESAIRATLKLAESDERLSVDASLLDTHKDLLCVGNGVVDLRDGALFDHTPELLMTKRAGADYDPAARSERWERVRREAFDGDEELDGWMQRLAGHSATGHTSEEVIAFLQGPGNTGKTTIAETIQAALADYAATANFASFLVGRNDASSASPDIAALEGVRAAFASEVAPGQTFNAQRIKSLTGGERIVARRLYQGPISYMPQFVLWLIANERPIIPASDTGAWRRMRLVPLRNVVPVARRDPDLKQALINDPDERAAVLAWIVAGAVQWYRHGLGTCAAVEDATQGYRQEHESDSTSAWIAACQLDPQASTPAAALHASYQWWCEEHGVEAVGPKALAKALEDHGLRKAKRESGHVWLGVSAPMQPLHPGSESSLAHARVGDSRDDGADGAEGAG